ncbi:unnamed protein product [Ascophyllum nodosum]
MTPVNKSDPAKEGMKQPSESGQEVPRSIPATTQERETLLARASQLARRDRVRSGSYGSRGEVDAAPPVRQASTSGSSSNPQPKKMLRFQARRATTSASPFRRPGEVKVESEHQGKSAANDNSTLVIAFIVMTFVGTGNRVFMKLQTYPMHNYPFFLSMLTTFIYVPVCFAYIAPMLAFGSRITPAQRAVPKLKFAIMGFLDSIAGIMGVFAVNYIDNAAMIVLLQQAAIPISMGISKMFLGAKYTIRQYIGASVVIAGIIVTLIPTLFGRPTGGSEVDPVTQMIWSGVQVLSCIPMCLSSVYKEKALGDDDIDVIFLNGWVAIFQFLSGLLFAVPSAYAMGLPVSELPRNSYEGFLCFLGHGSDVGETMANMMSGPGITIADHCEMAPVYVSLYLFFNVVYNVVLIVILKYGSSNVLFMASTVMVPIGNVAFSLKVVPHHQDLKLSDTLGLAFILTGLLIYRFSGPLIEAIRGRSRSRTSSIDRELVKKAHNKMPKIVGINQAEFLDPIIQRHAWELQKTRLLRSPQQIRSSFMHRLGLPPSPEFAATTTSRGNSPFMGLNASRASPGGYQYQASPSGRQYRVSPGGRRVSSGVYRSPPITSSRATVPSQPEYHRVLETDQALQTSSVGRSIGRKSFLADRREPV